LTQAALRDNGLGSAPELRGLGTPYRR